jgi:ubiquinone/menaquinone biosynthesis C-methylase UbiE
MSSTIATSQVRSSGLGTQQEKLARVYEADVYPLLGQKLADLLTTNLTLPGAAHTLALGCGLGTTTTDILHRTDSDSRLVVVESSEALVARARACVATEHQGRRALFRAHDLATPLPFADGGFDRVLASVELAQQAAPAALLSELLRVTKPGGELRLATTLAGTWHEFLDVYTDVLVRLHKNEAADAVAAYRGSYPDSEGLARQMEALGAGEVTVTTTHWELVFRTGREFFYAPVIELGPLPKWKAMAGKGSEMQDTFLAVKEAIDTYFAGSAFGVSICAGLFVAAKP